jgi:sugar transferase (PEP-CTERM/EpsH1 system associated)
MRILFLAHRLPYPPNKGDKIRSFWELKTLSERHEVDLFCFYDDPRDKSQIPNLRSYCHTCYAEPIDVFGSRIRAMSALARGMPFSTAFFYSAGMARRIAEAVRSRTYDLIFVFGSSMAQYTDPWPRLPRIIDLVDVDSDKWEQYSRHSWGPISELWKLESRRLAAYESDVVRSFSNTLICTEAEARLLRSKSDNGQITVLQNYLDMSYYHPEAVPVSSQVQNLQPYAIFTGTMDYFPNVDAVEFFCREVLGHVRARVPNLRFVIAGRNPSAPVLRLAKDPAVVVTGTLSDIRPFLRGAAVSVAPMRIARGVQNKILEALAMDVPVVASSNAAAALPRDIASLLTAEDKPKLLADRVIECVLAPPERSGKRHAAVKQYIDSLNLADQLEQLVRSAAADSSIRTREDRVEVGV